MFISAPIGRREKRKKTFESSSKMITKLLQSIFRSGQNCGIQGSKMPKISSFSRFSNKFRKTSIISGTIIARINPKTAFERELHLETDICRQIRPKVNGLASRLLK